LLKFHQLKVNLLTRISGENSEPKDETLQGKPVIRDDLEPIPPRMAGLPIDERGYPVPWFVPSIDGKPEFRALDQEKWLCAVEEKRCWVCGELLGVYKCFVAGPMCGINRTSSEPPSHVDCGRWSARNCPFLSNPDMVRREDGAINATTMRENTAGIAIRRNPGVTMLWITREFEVILDGDRKPLLVMGEPHSVEWWYRKRLATREEVLRSIETGLPALEAVAAQEPGGLVALQRCQKRIEKFLPQEFKEESNG